MRFAKKFGVTREVDDDWFDLIVEADTPLYIDPFLVFEDLDPLWAGAHDELIEFFDLVRGFINKAEGNRRSPYWGKAVRLLMFPEPKEFALGLSMGHPEGRGTGEYYAQQMAEALELFRSRAAINLHYVETFRLFCDGMGLDRLSDMFCNVIKRRFIIYTQQIVERHGIPTEIVPVPHARWSKQHGRWYSPDRLALPSSPVFNGAILLAPERFMNDIPRVTPEGFWNWSEINAGAILRFDLNYDLSESLSQAEKRQAALRVAREHPNLAIEYVDQIAAQDHKPYDVQNDPDLLVGWEEEGRRASQAQSPLNQPESPEKFDEWVRSLMERFKHAIEETDLWKVLWNDKYTIHRKEKIVQAVAKSMWVPMCEAANVDLSREVDLGRGSVDFKFSQGWKRRAFTEVKFIETSAFFTGASKQLPQYLKSAKADLGYYLCVGFNDRDMSEERLKIVRGTCEALSKAKGISLQPIYVDARPSTKGSASTLKDDQDKGEA